MEQSNKLKHYLAQYMAEIDFQNFGQMTHEEHYNQKMNMRDFDLLAYWLDYNGVFDGGEDMISKLKILVQKN
jgi:hypothetical protein